MLPWLSAYDHRNYARYLPVYLLHILSTEDTNTEALNLLKGSAFGVLRSKNHGFSRLPVDRTIEQTLNRNSKMKGGIVGFSLNRGAVYQWILSAQSRAAFKYKQTCRKAKEEFTK